MKFTIVTLLAIVINIGNVFAASYKDDVSQCDMAYEEASKRANTTVSIIQALSEHTDCYEKIAVAIIDKNYHQNAADMKKNFALYVNAAGEMTGFVGRPDSCYPQCGTVVGINAATARRSAARQYLDLLLQHI